MFIRPVARIVDMPARSGGSTPLHDRTSSQPDRGTSVVAISAGLSGAFGDQACRIIEVQIELAQSDGTRATWIEIHQHLCRVEDRHA